MLLFLLKNAYFFMMMAMLLICKNFSLTKMLTFFQVFSLQILQKTNLRDSSNGLLLINNYTDIVQKITIFASQFYVFLYLIDINSIYDGDEVIEEKRRQFDKKLGMSRL